MLHNVVFDMRMYLIDWGSHNASDPVSINIDIDIDIKVDIAIYMLSLPDKGKQSVM